MSEQNALPAPKSSLLNTLAKKIQADFLTNWRLVLLGLTGLVLSLASGWTTYDGIYNFTKTPVLSLMITFGIQGIMLVTAWLIGESFATGATGEKDDKNKIIATVSDIAFKSLQLFISILVLILIAFILAKFALKYDTSQLLESLSLNIFNIIVILAGFLLLALFLVVFSKADIIGPYARGMRVILAHLPLWLMFLSCMATSVFFSFDSLFSTIFTQEERKRAGDLRAYSKITGIISDIEVTVKRRKEEASVKLLASDSWRSYEAEILELGNILRSAPKALENEFSRKLRERQNILLSEEQSIAQAQSQQKNLVDEQGQLVLSLKRLKERRPALEVEVVRLENSKRTKQQELALREAEAQAEARGVGETGKEGRGPKFRELNKLVTKLKIEINAVETQLSTARNALNTNDNQNVIKRNRLIEVEREIAKLKTQERTSNENIKARQDFDSTASGLKVDVVRGLQNLETDLARFRQIPSRETLNQLQKVCGQLVASINEISQIRNKSSNIDCDPGKASQLGANVFALEDGLRRYQSLCGKEAKLPDGTDSLLDFGQRCVLTSGLPSGDTQRFRNALNRIALNRDDKAHRFVVTWNAFSDGNALAYLALSIALAIDALVFMSGLFGANAVVSPLSDSPKARSRPISQLKEIIDNALLPDKAYASDLVLNVMSPRHDETKSGYMAVVKLHGLALDQLFIIKKVLAAGASLGLVKHDEYDPHLFLIRSELFEYISSVRAYEAKLGNLKNGAGIPKYSNNQIRPTDPIPLDAEDARKDEIHNRNLPRNDPKPQLEFQSRKEERRKIFDTYLRALGITETIVIRLEDMKASDEPEQWQQHIEHIKDQNEDLSQRIDQIHEENKTVLDEAHSKLRALHNAEPELLFLVDDFAETFHKLLAGITIWKAYQQSKEQAEAVKEKLNVMEPLLHSVSDEDKQELQSILNQLEHAEQDKIDGWLELESNIEKLKRKLLEM